MGRFITIGDIPVEVIRKAGLKSVRLKICSKTRKAIVTAPLLTPDFSIKKFLLSHEIWLKKQMELIPLKTVFKEGEVFCLLGKEMTIYRQTTGATTLSGNRIIVSGEQEFLHRRVCDFIKKEVKKYIEEQAFKIAKEMGVLPKRISIKDTSSRWGSCSSSGCLSFSWRLGLAPLFVIDYVIAHELTHLIHMNHSDDFWRTLRQINPNVLKARKWLKENGHLLHKYT